MKTRRYAIPVVKGLNSLTNLFTSIYFVEMGHYSVYATHALGHLRHIRLKFAHIGCLTRISIRVSSVDNYADLSWTVVWHDACPAHRVLPTQQTRGAGQCWSDVAPSSTTLAQYQSNIWPTPRFCCAVFMLADK